MAGELIAVIDDDPIFLTFMGELLADEQYRPVLWSSTDAAMDMLRQEQPAVIVLDSWIERRESGWMLLQQIRRDPATAHIPIILCSADTQALQPVPSPDTTCSYVPLQKPFDIDDLFIAIRVAFALNEGKDGTSRPACGTNLG